VGQGRSLGSNMAGVADAIFGGWQLSGVLRISSSTPFTVNAGSRNWAQDGSSRPQQRPDLIPGQSNNPLVEEPAPGGGIRWYDPTAFKTPELGFYGNLGRNTLSSPAGVTTDFSLLKSIGLSQISEQMQLQFARRQGIGEAEFRGAYNSFAVETNLQRAEQLTRRYSTAPPVIDPSTGSRNNWGVPMIVINGKYAADVGSAGGQNQLIELINDLAAREEKKE